MQAGGASAAVLTLPVARARRAKAALDSRTNNG